MEGWISAYNWLVHYHLSTGWIHKVEELHAVTVLQSLFNVTHEFSGYTVFIVFAVVISNYDASEVILSLQNNASSDVNLPR